MSLATDPSFHVGVFQDLRDAVDVVAPLADDCLPQAGQVAQIPHRGGRHEAAPQQAALQQLRQPLRVLDIGLAARQHLRVPRIHQPDLHRAFEDGEHRPPIDPGRFHRDLGDAVRDQPREQFSQTPQRGRKGLGLGPALAGLQTRHAHGRHHGHLVHVEARTPGIHELHARRLSGRARAFNRVENFLMRARRASAAATRRGTSKRPGSGSATGFAGTSNVSDLWALLVSSYSVS